MKDTHVQGWDTLFTSFQHIMYSHSAEEVQRDFTLDAAFGRKLVVTLPRTAAPLEIYKVMFDTLAHAGVIEGDYDLGES